VAGRINDSQARAGIGMLGRAGNIAAHRVACCQDYARLLGAAVPRPPSSTLRSRSTTTRSARSGRPSCKIGRSATAPRSWRGR
jgi:hypothetical protein